MSPGRRSRHVPGNSFAVARRSSHDSASPSLRLSVLDQTPVAEESTGATALRNTLDLARHTDELAFHRYWVAGHHGSPTLAGPAPEVLAAAIASATSRLRVGTRRRSYELIADATQRRSATQYDYRPSSP